MDRLSVSSRSILALCLASTLALAGCSEPTPARPGGLPTGTLHLVAESGHAELRVEIAETDKARATGLMHRTHLDEDAGMVFLLPTPTDRGFWMKDTLIPLDIAFWDEGERIVAILEMEPCRSDPCPRYEPGVRYVGAVETNRGFFAGHGIQVGDGVALER